MNISEILRKMADALETGKGSADIRILPTGGGGMKVLLKTPDGLVSELAVSAPEDSRPPEKKAATEEKPAAENAKGPQAAESAPDLKTDDAPKAAESAPAPKPAAAAVDMRKEWDLIQQAKKEGDWSDAVKRIGHVLDHAQLNDKQRAFMEDQMAKARTHLKTVTLGEDEDDGMPF